MDKAMEACYLSRHFNGLITVDSRSIAVERGEVFSLLVPNGAGKTHTISMLCTILKPSSGSTRINGFNIVKQLGKKFCNFCINNV